MSTKKKSSKKKSEEVLCFGSNELDGCCGAEVVYDLSVSVPETWTNFYGETVTDDDGFSDDVLRKGDWRQARLALATTIPSMKKEIAKLKIAGFKPVLSWMGNHRRRITLWASPDKRVNLRFLKGKEE